MSIIADMQTAGARFSKALDSVGVSIREASVLARSSTVEEGNTYTIGGVDYNIRRVVFVEIEDLVNQIDGYADAPIFEGERIMVENQTLRCARVTRFGPELRIDLADIDDHSA